MLTQHTTRTVQSCFLTGKEVSVVFLLFLLLFLFIRLPFLLQFACLEKTSSQIVSVSYLLSLNQQCTCKRDKLQVLNPSSANDLFTCSGSLLMKHGAILYLELKTTQV